MRGLSRAAKGGSPADPFDYRIHHADGRIVWLRDHSTVVLGDDGQPSCVRGVSVDVTALKEAQAEGSVRTPCSRQHLTGPATRSWWSTS